jgi:Na+/H+ antiporter NhaC
LKFVTNSIDKSFGTSWIATSKGFLDMSEIFFLSMLLGGLGKMISAAGGIDYLLSLAHKFIKGRKSAELCIISLVSITDLAVANNTVAIIITGEVAKKICYTFKVDPRRSAGLLSTFSTIIQGVLPYGAQMLVLTGLAAGKVSPLEILPYSWFIYLLGVSALISIHILFSDGFIRRNPWNYELGRPELD